MDISAQIIDKDNQPVPFAVVHTSDSTGKPLLNSKNTTSDADGKFTLKNVSPNEYVSIKSVGYKPNTTVANSIKNKIQINPDESLNLEEVTVVADKPKPKNMENKEVVKEINWGLYTTILGGVLVIVGIIGLATGKKGK